MEYRFISKRLSLAETRTRAALHTPVSRGFAERDDKLNRGRRFGLSVRCIAAVSAVLLSCSAARAQQFGVFTSFQPREITPGLYMRFSGERIGYQWNMSLPVVLNDPYNGGRTNISYWSLAMGSIVAVEFLTGGDFEIAVDSSGNSVPGILALILPALSNGQLSVNLLPKSAADQAGVQIAPFIGWDTALFGMRKVGWFRISPQAGISCLRIFGTPREGKRRVSVALRLGLKEDFEYSSQKQKHMFAFLTLEAGFY